MINGGQSGEKRNESAGELDDEAASATWPCPPTDGNAYQPTGSLADFDGEDMSGTWTLTVADGANQDGGSLTSWGLEICYTPSLPCNDPDNPTRGRSAGQFNQDGINIPAICRALYQ